MQYVFGWTLQLCQMNEENNLLLKRTIFRSRNDIKRYHFTISSYYLRLVHAFNNIEQHICYSIS